MRARSLYGMYTAIVRFVQARGRRGACSGLLSLLLALPLRCRPALSRPAQLSVAPPRRVRWISEAASEHEAAIRFANQLRTPKRPFGSWPIASRPGRNRTATVQTCPSSRFARVFVSGRLPLRTSLAIERDRMSGADCRGNWRQTRLTSGRLGQGDCLVRGHGAIEGGRLAKVLASRGFVQMVGFQVLVEPCIESGFYCIGD